MRPPLGSACLKGTPLTTASTSVLRRTLTATAVAGSTAALVLAGISSASAHVGVTPDKTTANSYALLTFGIPHGCEKSGTTKVTITLLVPAPGRGTGSARPQGTGAVRDGHGCRCR